MTPNRYVAGSESRRPRLSSPSGQQSDDRAADERDGLLQPNPKVDGAEVQFDGVVPTFEDKVAQRAIVMVLELVYEQHFLPCSYGFRPGRSAHQAFQSLHTAVMGQGLRWVIDIDIVKYFDSI